MTATTPLGRVLRDEHGIRLEFVRTYDTDPADVWSALTDSERLGRWFGTWSGDPAAGTVELRTGFENDAGPQTVIIVECEEPTQLVVDLPSPEDTWRLQLSLTANTDGSTTLVFVQRLAEPYDATGVGPGWHYYLDRLGAVIAHTPVDQDWGTDYYPALSDAYTLPD
ncbi:uncharacterized protein YndB with AHSA1/START domain [Prauserella isguenensis]|uniref:Uncharacterized protein YndB with AHSA1/START domain n=1 Tax=Prauserella isguenensis TaxID=1470180 RepID=A0A839S1H9_9PSEU|nr:SRPBCC domain-containing protein [Prauserella isguenensis]MBB3051242.1 uncharacterized protein YndB with AHSA1/START domain [Prauserella isguenensis]